MRLSADELAFFRDHPPWGFILFARNVSEPSQVRDLTAQMREVAGRNDAPILIDQEGGRVRRLRPPHWPFYPPARVCGLLFKENPEAGLRAAFLQSRLIANDLHALGINVDCLPVLDTPVSDAHDIIGDRAYSQDPHEVAQLGRAACEGLLAGGVLPVIKHIPGHGRARADSHLALPVVDATRRELGCTDFHPFLQLADMPLAMTAHVVYSQFDAKNPATSSRTMIRIVVRGWIGFDGLLMSDDLSMRALSGDYAQRTKRAFAAGCDVVLHCNGELAEMLEISAATPLLRGSALKRAKHALQRLREPDAADIPALRAEFEDLTARAGVSAAA